MQLNRTTAGALVLMGSVLGFVGGAIARVDAARTASIRNAETLHLFAEVTGRLCDLSRLEGYTLGDVDACEEATDTLHALGALPREVTP